MSSGKKRLVVACDGTWMNSDLGAARKSWFSWSSEMVEQNPTNVTRICRAINAQANDGTDQIVYYQAGVGSEDSISSFFLGGYLGDGFSENVREAYAFIAKNYREGDEIFLIGFSRGAFTARSIAGMITDMGLLTRPGMEDFYPIFADWEHQADKDYELPVAKHLKNRPRYNEKNKDAYLKLLKDNNLSRLNVPIKAVAVWDTVGTLGVPDNISWDKKKKYAFVNTRIGPNIENAFHALALDEVRKPFAPTIWESTDPKKPEPDRKTALTLKQCWFPGAHSNVGGSKFDTSIENITLAWILAQLAPLLEFDRDYVLEQQELNNRWYTTSEEGKKEGVRTWGMGMISDSSSWIQGSEDRTPGTYYRADPESGELTNKRLENTFEYVHPCVRTRVEMHGRGVGDSDGPYEPTALSKKQGWKLYKPNEAFNGGRSPNPWPKEADGRYKWASAHPAGEKSPVYLLEDQLDDLSKDMIKESARYDQYQELKALAA